jgi:hypothetical protein
MSSSKLDTEQFNLTNPPKSVRRAKLDNLALIPGSLLPYKHRWQKMLDGLPAGSRLIILPSADGSARRCLEKVSSALKARGCRVTTVPASELFTLDSPTQMGLVF